ncbi:hypothetical protein ACFLT9_09705 [Acidobacteriota bacterium]
MKVFSFLIRGNYPNRRSILTSIKGKLHGEPNILKGYRPPVLDLFDEKKRFIETLNIEDSDLPFLLDINRPTALRYIELLRQSQSGDLEAVQEIKRIAFEFFEHQGAYYFNMPSVDEEFIVPCTSRSSFEEEHISNKGSILLNLNANGYPVPDFVILSSSVYHQSEEQRFRHIEAAMDSMEKLTAQRLGASINPLILAIRCAMPCYMPGIMPTYLNVGITEKSFPGLVDYFGRDVAHRIYLNNMKNLLILTGQMRYAGTSQPDHKNRKEVESSVNQFRELIQKKDPLLLEDPYYQTAFFARQAYFYFENNSDLMLTLSRGKEHYPSLIIQKMVCTVRDKKSQVGVLFSRHPRTGEGKQVESAYNIFGEEIMAGTAETTKTDFSNGEEIETLFPAISHFSPSLQQLENNFASPVTIEFATDISDSHNFFALLQLNRSEVTGRSAFVSVMDLYDSGVIEQHRITELIKPYHIKQIESDAIDPKSFEKLSRFTQGLSILPRTAVSARLYFSASEALKAKKEGQKVCFCKKSFEPSDSVVMREVDAIVSLTSAAIHVVTICQSYGLPALLNVEEDGVTLSSENRLRNANGLEIGEGEWVTISSRNRCLYKGAASFRSARLIRFMRGELVNLSPAEQKAFQRMAEAYSKYNAMITDLKLHQLYSLNEIIRLVILELREETEKASELVNLWFDHNKDLYVEEVLKSEMGDHMKQNDVFNLLTLERQIEFFRRALKKCKSGEITGYTAGTFMLGRFINQPQSIAFWESFSSKETAILINEWVLFEKYMLLLHEVGERKLTRTKERILEGGFSSLALRPNRVKTFITLKLSQNSLEDVKEALPSWSDAQSARVLDLLLLPYSAFYDFEQPWSVSELKNICEENNIPVPEPDEH